MRVVEDIWLNELWLTRFKSFVVLKLDKNFAEDGCEWCRGRLGNAAYAIPNLLGEWHFRVSRGTWDFAFCRMNSTIVFAFEDKHVADVMSVEFKLKNDGSFIRKMVVE